MRPHSLRQRLRVVAAAFAAGWLSITAAALAQTPRGPVVETELAPETQAATPGGVIHVALRQKIKAGWHTYWRNPGDSGEPTRITWTLPAGWRAGDIVWPAPSRHSLGPLTNYGYEGEVYLPVPIDVPASARTGRTEVLRAKAAWLVCEKVCIPEEATLELRLPVVAGTPGAHPRFGRPLARTLAAAPKLAGLEAAVQLQDAAVRVAVLGDALRDADASQAYFYPHDGSLIDHAKPQTVERGPEGLTLTMAPAPAAMEALLKGQVSGVLALGDQAFEISARPGRLPAEAAGLGPPGRGAGGGRALLQAVALAFLGGLILNFMPCVFPVLSMKAAGLARHGRDPAAARVHGLVFAAGVLTTFAALAAALIAARAAGQAVGWGFQLQSPVVVGGLSLLMLAVALNLAGLFEVGSPIQHAGSGLASRRGVAGAFFTGVLAVVVAAPCTAPFMAGAVGYALVQPPATALVVFLALGLGLAAPFTALCFAPRLLARLPAPGPWMGRLRRLLALPMLAAAVWLAWVFARQAGFAALTGLLAASALLAFALWLWGHRQREGLSDRGDWVLRATAAALVAVAGGWLASGTPGSPPTSIAGGAGAPSRPYSAARLAALRAEGKPVFVNFTADWCVSCKVNERVALSSRKVEDAFERTGVVYLKGDWTNRDAEIARALEGHGRSGVPLYLVYGAGSAQPVVLPQLLTEGAVVRAMEEAATTQAAE